LPTFGTAAERKDRLKKHYGKWKIRFWRDRELIDYL
jgi:hypothetical protein